MFEFHCKCMNVLRFLLTLFFHWRNYFTVNFNKYHVNWFLSRGRTKILLALTFQFVVIDTMHEELIVLPDFFVSIGIHEKEEREENEEEEREEEKKIYSGRSIFSFWDY